MYVISLVISIKSHFEDYKHPNVDTYSDPPINALDPVLVRFFGYCKRTDFMLGFMLNMQINIRIQR